MILTLKILGAVAALGLGIWLGLPGRYSQSVDEIEQTMAMGTGRRKKVKRHFTPLAWFQRKVSSRPSEGHQRRGGGFNLERPDDR